MKKKLYWPRVNIIPLFSPVKKTIRLWCLRQEKKYTVNFSVAKPSAALSAVSNKTGSNVSDAGRKFHSQARTAADTLEKYVKTLYYLVYNSSGALIQQLDQDSTSVNFGNVSYDFVPGTYTIVVVGNATVYRNANASLPTDYFGYNPPAKPDHILREDFFKRN